MTVSCYSLLHAYIWLSVWPFLTALLFTLSVSALLPRPVLLYGSLSKDVSAALLEKHSARFGRCIASRCLYAHSLNHLMERYLHTHSLNHLMERYLHTHSLNHLMERYLHHCRVMLCTVLYYFLSSSAMVCGMAVDVLSFSCNFHCRSIYWRYVCGCVHVCAEKHRSNSEKHRSNSEKHRSNSEKHRSNSEKHRSNSEKHRSNSEKHRSNSEKHRSNSEKHRSNSEKHRSNSITQESWTLRIQVQQ